VTPEEEQQAIEETRKRRKAVAEKRKHVEPKSPDKSSKSDK